jgi:hypothetical protein
VTKRLVTALVLGVLLVAGLVAAGIALLRPDPPPPRVTALPVASLAPGADAPEELARAACVQLRLAGQGVSAGSAADLVRRQLAAARALAAEALRRDGSYAALSGGAAALDEAVRRDEAAAAAAGLQVAVAECSRLPAA